ncbi:diguanylate cyclase [Devosia sp. 1566]|uniref:diguanylate cyclase domain-containing protein n=1 Tax=Devosia sp. 1566 TaxID=2499144 RepID=UPI0013E35E6A|nr:diguanylate cyclase [Devosia sp. 1566]
MLKGAALNFERRARTVRLPLVLANLYAHETLAPDQLRFADGSPVGFLAFLPLGGNAHSPSHLLTLGDKTPRSLGTANQLAMIALEAFHPGQIESGGPASFDVSDDLILIDQATASAGLGIWQCHLAENALRWSSGVYDLFGIERGAPLSRDRTVSHYSDTSRAAMEESRARAIEARGEFTMDAEIIRADGQKRWMRLSAGVQLTNGRPERLFGTKQDITEDRLLIDRMRHLAETDAMTGLANRARLQARLDRPQGISALLLVDLDGFKAINDTYGHAFGDACLREMAQRLRACCVDVPLVGRLGGDEFAVVLHAEHGPEYAERLARQIVEVMQLPFEYHGAKVQLGASVGLAFRLEEAGEELFRQADQALYAAKAEGRGTSRSFSRAGC